MEKISLEQNKTEQFLTSPQFQRMFEVLATYQRLLEENKNDEEKYGLIKKRFHDEFESSSLEESERPPSYSEILAIRKQIFILSETGQLTKEKLAGLFARSALADKMLESYRPKSGSISESGAKFINEVVEYSGGEEGEDSIDLNIMPAPVKGTVELLSKIKEGFQLVAEELNDGPLQHIREVQMRSWLLGTAFADKVTAIFGENINIIDLSDEADNSTVREIQKMAISYNKRAAEKYLLTGELPEVKEIQMTSEDFIKRFGIVGKL